MTRPRLIVADNHALLAESFTKLLEGEFEVAGSATNGRQLLEMCERTRPDLVLTDLNLAAISGLEAASHLRRTMPSVKLIFLTVQYGAEYVRAAFRSGARGYVVKQCRLAELYTAIHEVLKGRCYVTPLLTNDIVSFLAEPAGPDKTAALSPRQREVLRMVAAGQTAKEIGQRLNISPKTVEYHKASIEGKLGLHSTAELIRYAFERGFMTAPERAA